MRRPEPSPLAAHWTLDPEVTFLNHGAFGACPREVLALQSELRARMERDPLDFMVRALEPLLDDARTRLAAFLHADPDDLAFVDNA
ncbi:MAG TPA: aminotransferase, partial [Myxococcaceae bacterium]|nr:aminotransferase [Myxococcaceae bacterium]